MNLTPSKYKESLRRSGSFAGQAKKNQSDLIMESTWYEDLATRTCYLYDYYHDNEPLKLEDLHPESSEKIPVDLKYIVNGSQTYAKDAITQHIMFKPSEEGKNSLVPYYKEDFIDRYSATFPVGLFCDIPDAKGKYNRWLVVDKANVNDPQFPTYEVLRCDYILQYVINGIKYQYPGVLRSQSSYNAGDWLDFLIRTVEDQQIILLPLNRETEKIYYSQRIIIDTKVETEPRTWRVSKVNRIASNGIVKLTFAQEHFDVNKDYIERNEDGKIIGMWADYFTNGEVKPVEPKELEPITNVYSKVTITGKPVIKTNDSYKKLSVDFYREGIPINLMSGEWKFAIKPKDADVVIPLDDPTVLLSIKHYGEASDLKENQIKIKYIGDLEEVGSVLIATYVSNNSGREIKSSIELNISRL